MEIVDAICTSTKVEDGNGTVLAKNQPVIKDIRVTGEIDSTQNPGNNTQDTSLLTRDSEGLLSGKHNVEIEIENYGTIALTLDADMAPVTVTNFINLVKDNFYDGLTFHRIISGFMMQGGDPEGTGMGGSEQNIQGEFAANGIVNTLSHTRGVISMARANVPNSASSQFFIVHEDSTFLDGNYAAFGQVTNGIEVVDAICENTPVQDGNGTVAAADQPKIKEIRIVE
ncbi:MAG: peptidylprolyl isomerase [Lachnospiraceae bacterium]|nr:peptidylprolyl isomerase [Lachnospiraceae bacterium]MBQ8549558.1 peptidylprolyl isomerase [Lachnospiraceae bacterium]